MATATVYRRLSGTHPELVEHAWVVTDQEGECELLLPDGRGLLQVTDGPPGTRTDARTGATTRDEDGVRGLGTRPVVRRGGAGGVRLGLQLHPLALARLGVTGAVDTWLPLTDVLPAGVVAAARTALLAGDATAAARALEDGLAVRAAAVPVDDEVDRLAEALALADDRRGLVTVTDLARALEVTVSDVHRWSVRHLGAPPAAYLAAVRFTGFVREAVGPGPVAPADVVAALRWYARAGQAPREVERFTGLTPVELHRLEERVVALTGEPPAVAAG